MKRIIVCICALLMITTVLTGCGGDSVVDNAKEGAQQKVAADTAGQCHFENLHDESGTNGRKISFERFDGVYEWSIKSNSENLRIKYDTKLESGELKCMICDGYRNILAEVPLNASGELQLQQTTPKIMLHIEGNAAKAKLNIEYPAAMQ